MRIPIRRLLLMTVILIVTTTILHFRPPTTPWEQNVAAATFDMHQNRIAVLPLLPWEEQAIEGLTKKGGNMSCVPPQGVHDT